MIFKKFYKKANVPGLPSRTGTKLMANVIYRNVNGYDFNKVTVDVFLDNDGDEKLSFDLKHKEKNYIFNLYKKGLSFSAFVTDFKQPLKTKPFQVGNIIELSHIIEHVLKEEG